MKNTDIQNQTYSIRNLPVDTKVRKPVVMVPAMTKTEKVAQQVLYYISSRYNTNYPLDKQPLERIIEAIKAFRGVDNRTVETWIRAFGETGLIKPVKVEFKPGRKSKGKEYTHPNQIPHIYKYKN
jgi:hypothetical protein